MYALIQHMRKTDTKLNEMRCHALRKMWTTIPSADAHFAGPVTSKMDPGFGIIICTHGGPSTIFVISAFQALTYLGFFELALHFLLLLFIHFLSRCIP